MSKQIWKPGALLAPVPPALVSCGSMDAPNLLTIGWTGIVSTHPATTYISVRPERFSYPLILKSGAFVINLTTEALVRAADFCGVRSGRDCDKFARCGLTAAAASAVTAPILAESPVNIECRVRQVIELGSHHMFLAEIAAIQVDDSLIDSKGRLCLDRAGLVAYAHGEYFAMGEKLGSFGYSVRKKPPKKSAGQAKEVRSAEHRSSEPRSAESHSQQQTGAAKKPAYSRKTRSKSQERRKKK